MSKETFISELNEIEKSIEKLKTEDQCPIGDGPVDQDAYFTSEIKILWLLKESYDHAGDGEGEWSLAKLLGEKDVYDRFLKSTKSRNT